MTVPFIEWLQGSGGDLILAFLEKPTEKSFRAIYKDAIKHQKRDKSFISKDQAYQLGLAMTTIYFRGYKLEEANAAKSLRIFGEMATDLTGDKNWIPPDPALPHTYPAYEVWFRTRLSKPIPERLLPTFNEIKAILPPAIK